jgi:hypothetical protein
MKQVLSASLAIAATGAFAPLAPGGSPVVGVDVVPLRAVLHQDVRVLWLGDSYALPMPSRLSGASLLAWRIDAWTAVTMGDGPNWFFVQYDALAPGLTMIDGESGYRLFDTGPDAMARFGLPLWRLREYFTETPSQGPVDVLRYRLLTTHLDLGYHGPFARSGDKARVRSLFLEPPGTPPALPALHLTPENGAPFSFDPRAASRPKRVEGKDPETDAPTPPADGQIFGAPIDLELTANATGRLLYTLGADAPAPGERGYVFPAGFSAYRVENGARMPGLHFSTLTDGSWAYAGFGRDLPSGAPGAGTKSYTRAQLAHWLDASSVDPLQPIFVFVMLNVEDIDPQTASQQMEAMVDLTNAAAADAGLGPVHHCFVIPWMHRIEGQDILGRHEEQEAAAFALASDRPDVSAISIYAFTDGVMFNGSPESRQWLIDHGYDQFSYGTITVNLATSGPGPNNGLLDIYRSHPAGRDAGAFFASIIEKVIVDACPADYAPPHGVLDLSDITAFLTRFSAQKPSADLAPPSGVFDLADLSAFVASFQAGCAN